MSQNKKFEFLKVLEILQNCNFKASVEAFKREVGLILNDDEQNGNLIKRDEHQKSYSKLIEFVESCGVHKYEMSTLLYPILVYMYLDLIENDRTEEAGSLMEMFGPSQKFYYQDDLKKIAIVTNKHQMKQNGIIGTFKSYKFVLIISLSTLSHLNYFLEQSKLFVVLNIIKTNLHFDTYKGIIRNDSQIDATLGGMMGTVTNLNMTRVFYGILPIPKLKTTVIIENNEDFSTNTNSSPEESKQKKSKTNGNRSESPELESNSITNSEPDVVLDPNAPPENRIPLPPLTDFEIMERIDEYKESLTKVVLGPKVLPSICSHTILNSSNNINCAKISENLTMLAVGCRDSRIKVFSLTSKPLRSLEPAEFLEEIDFDDDDLEELVFDNSEAKMRTMIGHSALIYSVSFSKNCKNLLSCSEDETIRLWSLEIWSCVVVYNETKSPVYDVKFSPFGHYFASASGDKMARLWATNNKTPLRIFAGHFQDVNCIQFHPNSNYVATGSSDRYVFLWDCLSGEQVRLMTGHKSPIRSLEFSVCGRFLVSGSDTEILVWDIKFGKLVAPLRGHQSTITSLCFSRCGSVLASSSLDTSLKLWNFNNITKYVDLEDEIGLNQPRFTTDDSFMLKEYRTEESPILHLYFTLRNVLLLANTYNGSKFYNDFCI